MSNEELQEKVLTYLMNAEGKGVKTIAEIAKAVGVQRRDCSQALRVLEEEGKVAPAGVAAGVAGYKAVK